MREAPGVLPPVRATFVGPREARYVERAVPRELEPWVVAAWRVDPLVDTRYRVLPDGCADVIAAPDGLLVVGPMTVAAFTTVSAGASLHGVRMRPGALPALTGTPASEIVDRATVARPGQDPLALLAGGPPQRAEPLRPAGAGSRRAGALGWRGRPPDPLRLVAVLARHAPPPDPVVATVLALLALDPTAPVSALARETGYSERQLRRRLLDGVGLGPKRLARIVRMQALLAAGAHDGGWARAAVDHGWYDEAHMVNDVTRLAGASPAALVDGRSFQGGAAGAA
jgi:AraC-like DNA-binding protein